MGEVKVEINFIPIKKFKYVGPIEVEFTEAFISNSVLVRIAEATVNSVLNFSTQEKENKEQNIEVFAIREVLQNAIDTQLEKCADIKCLDEIRRNPKKYVKIERVGPYIKIESPGILPEEAFVFGFTTKKEVKLPEPYCLIGRFGLGLKEALLSYLYFSKPHLIVTGNHAYIVAEYCNGEFYTFNKSGSCAYAVLRGEIKNNENKTTIYLHSTHIDEKLFVKLLWDKSDTDITDGNYVYHNGLFSGIWNLPISVNLPCVESDQYRKEIPAFSSIISKSMEYLKNEKNEEELAKILSKRRIVKKYMKLDIDGTFLHYLKPFFNVIVRIMIPYLSYNKSIAYAIDDCRDFEKVEVPGVCIKNLFSSDREILIGKLKEKGYNVMSHDEYVSKIGISEIKKYVIPEDKIPIILRSAVWLGKWLFWLGIRRLPEKITPRMTITKTPYNVLPPEIANFPVYIVSHSYPYRETGELGHASESYIALFSPKVLNTLEVKPNVKSYLAILLHELSHVFLSMEHGTFEFEAVRSVLSTYFVRKLYNEKERLSPEVIFMINVSQLAIRNPKIFIGAKEIIGLSEYLIDFSKIETGYNECGIVNNVITVPGDMTCILKREDDKIIFTISNNQRV